MHNADTPERFELVLDWQNETVNRVLRQEIPEGSLPLNAPFWVTHALYHREDGTGKWVTGNEWERRDLISNRRIEQWTAERWRAQTGEEATARAQEDLREYFGGDDD